LSLRKQIHDISIDLIRSNFVMVGCSRRRMLAHTRRHYTANKRRGIKLNKPSLYDRAP